MDALTRKRSTTLMPIFTLVLMAGVIDKRFLTEAIKNETLVVRHGSNLTLPCRNDGSLASKTKIWQFGNSIIYAGQKSFAPSHLTNIYCDGIGSLYIEGAESQNEGFYRCQLGSDEILNQYIVTIEVLPTLTMNFIGNLSHNSEECQVSNQRSYQIKCIATGSSHNVWISFTINNATYVGRENVKITTGNNKNVHTESVILYRPKTDHEEVSCRATGQTNSYVMEKMTVSVCEETSKQYVPLTAKYGENVTMTCKSPAMTMWEFPIRNNSRLLNEGELVHINSVRIENEGEYKCFKAGEATKITNLTVQVIPKLSMKAVDEDGLYDNVTVFTHKLYKLYCNSTVTRPPAVISWKINSIDYVTGLRIANKISGTIGDTWDYHSSIHYIPSKNDNNVSCSIRDGHSGLEWTKYLFIETFDRSPEVTYNISVAYGNNISFGCGIKLTDDFLWHFSNNDQTLTLMQLKNVKEFKETGVNGNGSSFLYIEEARIEHQGSYICYKLNELAIMFVLDVIVCPSVEVVFEDNPDPSNIIVYRFKSYFIQCLVSGVYPPVTILWKVNGIAIVDHVYHGNLQPNANDTKLFDTVSTLNYQPNKNDKNLTCLVTSIEGEEELVLAIQNVVTFEAEVEEKHILHGGNVSLRCNYSDAVQLLHWSFKGIKITCNMTKCNIPNVVGFASSKNDTTIAIVNLNAANEGQYICYHGLEEVKINHITMKVKLRVYLMPGRKRIYPDTVELYEGSRYTLVCTANSTNDIKSLKWLVNGARVSEEVITTTHNRSLTLRQVTSRYDYTSVISHLTISCIAESDDGTIITERVNIHLVLSFRKKVILSGGLSLFLLILATILVLICRSCSVCTKKKKAVDNSIKLRERSNELHNIDVMAWRRAMNAFAERSSSKHGVIRRSRMLFETYGAEFYETGDTYDRFIARSFRSSVLPFSRLSFSVQLKLGAFKDSWIGKLRHRRMVETETYISTVSENATENHKFRWDMFVKHLIDMPFSNHIASIIGVSMNDGRMYLLQEFLTVENLRTYIQSNTKLLITEGHVSRNILHIALGMVDGMDFLAHNKFCHPALSIHKILIGHDKECKLYDFCLFEDATGKIESIKSKEKRRFSNLAKETILQGEYTLSSDVWSVGTALWEIFSLGDEPFEGLQQKDIRLLIQREHHLPQPAHCSRQFYHVMLDCWVDIPERPTLATVLENLRTTIQEYVEMADASRTELAGAYSSGSDTFTSIRHTYAFTDNSSRNPEENIYERVDGSFKTISE